jgi:tripartite-type tricarboxylate transporter receptor subunit TctC
MQKEGRMKKRSLVLTALIFSFVLTSSVVSFGAAPYYEGKTVRLIVGTSPGGGFDSYARLLSRHLAKHIPGAPTIIVENMPAAGGLASANHLYKVARPNGLTIATFNGTLLFEQVLGQEGIEFESQKFEYIGALARVTPVCLLSKASGITSMDAWMASKTPVKIGGIGPGNLAPDNTPKILNAAIGLPLQHITGYKGTAEIRLAVEGNEVHGCFLGWESAKTTWRKDLESGMAFVAVQAVPKVLPDLPKVPLAISYAKTEEARILIEAGIHSCGLFSRPFAMTPGTPKDRVELMRKAFQETLKDKDFLAEAQKSRLDLDPVTGEELHKAVTTASRVDKALVTKLKNILYK